MRAAVHRSYGPPDVLRVEDVPRPEPGPGDVLVRVVSSSVTRTDCGLRSNEYWFSRLLTGVRRPKRIVAGMEFAGVVEETGTGVTAFAPGDEVFGIKLGANAEYNADFVKLWKDAKPLGFRYGYLDKQLSKHMLITKKVAQK